MKNNIFNIREKNNSNDKYNKFIINNNKNHKINKDNIEKKNDNVILNSKNFDEYNELNQLNRSNLFISSNSFKRLKGKILKSIDIKKYKYNKYSTHYYFI